MNPPVRPDYEQKAKTVDPLPMWAGKSKVSATACRGEAGHLVKTGYHLK
jgi:hypothetical protein